MARKTFRIKALFASVVVVLGLAAVTAWAINHRGEEKADEVMLSSASGSIKLYNSKAGKSILSAQGMVPGSSTTGSVRVGNPNQAPISITLAPKSKPQGVLGQQLHLDVVDTTKANSQKVYSGSLSAFKKLSLGKFPSKNNRQYKFTATLPSSTGNSFQGSKTDITFVWKATSAGPPPECRVRAMRTRFFIFRKRPFVRMVTRYRASAPGRVVIRFFWRKPGNRFGKQVGQMTTHFQRSPKKFKLKRIWSRRTPAILRQMRKSKRGFMAQIRPVGSPGYCPNHLNLQLSQLKRKYGQFVWFQKGSFHRR